jgi:hypothetical protein
MNTQRNLDPLVKARLGQYVYALRDPRDKKIFYVGRGDNDRVFHHFNEAEKKSNLPIQQISSKAIRILDIWKNDEDVEWFIVAHNLTDGKTAEIIESAVYDSLGQSQNGEPVNENRTPRSSLLLPEDLDAMAAEPVNPSRPFENVFVFPIHRALVARKDIYASTRAAWRVANHFQKLGGYAVGLQYSIAKGTFEIEEWNEIAGINKQEFVAKGHPDPIDVKELLNTNWTKIIAAAKGFWQRGNYLIVEFDGAGKFRVKRGSQNKDWQDC